MPSNRDVADLFAEMADLLEIRGGEPHRVRAFRRAARVVEKLPEPAERTLAWGTLKKRRGIGDGIVRRLKEILSTGTCGELEKLRAALPGVRELVRVRGVGAATVRELYRRFRVTDATHLEALARSGALLRLPRFTAEANAQLLYEIEVAKHRVEKVPLAVALAAAEAIAEKLRAAPGVVQVAVAGSCRRGKDLVGDLDLLAAAENAAPVVEVFTRLDEVREVLLRRGDGANVRLQSLRQVDLRVVPFDSWGAALQSLTGSKMHNIALRARFNRRGLKLTERGVKNRADGSLLRTGRTEEEVYAAVGLPWIPPELRESQGELEAAEKGRLPRLVEAADLQGDLHLRTGASSLPEVARTATALGYEYVATAVPAGGGARRLERELGLRILAGAEVEILPDGSLGLDAESLARLDWVVAAVHDRLDMPEREMTARYVRAMESGYVDAIAHPTGRLLGERPACAVDVYRLLEAARRLGVALEVNGDPRRMDLDDRGCRQARELGVRTVLTSAAGSPAEMRRRELALATARRGWLEKQDVLNTRAVEEVLAFRGDRLRRRGLVVAGPGGPPDAAAEREREVGELAERLGRSPLQDELYRRLERYLRRGGDSALREALRRRSANPVQEAFNLLTSRPEDERSRSRSSTSR